MASIFDNTNDPFENRFLNNDSVAIALAGKDVIHSTVVTFQLNEKFEEMAQNYADTDYDPQTVYASIAAALQDTLRSS